MRRRGFLKLLASWFAFGPSFVDAVNATEPAEVLDEGGDERMVLFTCGCGERLIARMPDPSETIVDWARREISEHCTCPAAVAIEHIRRVL